MTEFNDVTLRRNLTPQILLAGVAIPLISGLLRAAWCEAGRTLDPPHLSAPADEPRRISAGSWRGPVPSQHGKEQTCQHPAPAQGSAGAFAPTHLPLGRSPANLRAARLEQSQVGGASDGEDLGAALLIRPGPGVPTVLLPSKTGIRTSPREQQTALLKANTLISGINSKAQGGVSSHSS